MGITQQYQFCLNQTRKNQSFALCELDPSACSTLSSMGQVDPKSTMLCLTLESLFLPDDLRLGSGSVCLLKPKVGEKVTGVVGSSTALSYPNKHAKPECSAPRLCV